MLFYPKLPKIIGSDYLEVRIRSIHGIQGSAYACHVFGHTHFCWDAVVDGIQVLFVTHFHLHHVICLVMYTRFMCFCLMECRYVQAPLAYPRERKRRMNGGENWLPFCLYIDGKFSDTLSPCYWSDYYSANQRTPNNTELAPWVARFYNQT